MKKSELGTLIIGSQIENKKNGEVFTINNIIEIDSKVKYQLSNDKTITASSMLRWYNLVQQETVEQVELPIVPVEPVEQVEPEQPETVEPEPTPNVKLTDLEKEAMWILKNNEYEDCFDREPLEDGTFWYRSAWCFSVIEGLSCGIQGAKGVLGSLVKKGLVIVDEGEYNYNSKQYDSSIRLTDLGYLVGIKALENYNLDEVEPKVGNEEQPPVQPTPVEVKPVEVKPVNLVDQMIEYCNIHNDKYIVKHNSDHIAIKGINKRNLIEIHSSKRAINLVVRHQIFSEEEQMILNNCRIVGNGTFTLDLKFEITKLEEFVNTLNRASVYVPVKK
nr:MAG TPA: hypothetical protein [Caudoviricetes sp.]